ncbi:MAG: hypothetical protein JKY37_05385 [Nannocystaceae bacterium]|nr:hypothetical protein [Nannocystaceae bacterium]
MRQNTAVQRPTACGNEHRATTLARSALLAALTCGLACSTPTKVNGDEPDPSGAADGASKAEEANPDTVAPSIELGPITKGSLREHPAGVAWVFDGDPAAPTKMDIGEAEARGYTVIDLSDDWVPYILSEKTAGTEDATDNAYRETYIDLANNRVNHWGDALDEGDRNYLELYGIPSTLSVIAREWNEFDAEVVPCLQAAGYDRSVFAEFDGVITFRKSGKSKRNKSARYHLAQLKRKMRKAKLDPESADALLATKDNPATRKAYTRWREYQDEVDVIDHAQRRFRCERLFTGGDGSGKFAPGVYDSPTTHALATFERKHELMGWGHFKGDNVELLALDPRQSVHQRLLRVLQERTVLSAGVLEDGSAATWKNRKGKTFTYKDAEGNEHELRDLASEYLNAVVAALDIDTPAKAKTRLAGLSDLSDKGFGSLLIAVKLPEKPPYYGANMQFETLIDRGDVWYDFPYDSEGNKTGQPRRSRPKLTLYVNYEGQKIPLVHWRTTIGSWRNEVKDGELMMKYKNSDVGARVWKNIVAAPVWIPPANTPPAELIKGAWRKGKYRTDVNYPTIGPGYRSAYGLVAAYHIKQVTRADGSVAELDNGIRTHGSVDYMSILRRFSHGCHRLLNMNAVRMFSFVLLHRDYKREGQQSVGVGRYIEHNERTYHMKIKTRGYKYELVEPIPVEVTNGRIRGRRRSPIVAYVPRPVKEEDLVIDGEDGGDTDSVAPAEPTVTAVPQ